MHDCIPLGTAIPLVESHAQEITERSDLFTGLERRTFVHDRLVTANEWIKELETHSPIAMLDRVTREELLGELLSVSPRRLAINCGYDMRLFASRRRDAEMAARRGASNSVESLGPHSTTRHIHVDSGGSQSSSW